MSKINTRLTQLWRDDQVQFRLDIAFKVMMLPCLTAMSAFVFFWSFLRMDLYFFEAYRASNLENFQEIYYDYVLSTVVGYLPVIFLFILGCLVLGLYISNMVLRPFRTISLYCEDTVEGKETSYDREFFSELRLLTQFSDFFFSTMQRITKNGKLEPVEVPEKYTRIHKPVFEKSFFIQFFMLVLITSIATGTAIFLITIGIHGQIISFAEKTIQLTPGIKFFLEQQENTLMEIMFGVLAVHLFLHIAFCFHLYNKVAAPAFGIFATFRSFLKGNYSSRIHLIGYYYLRPECRKINRYLTWLQKKYD